MRYWGFVVSLFFLTPTVVAQSTVGITSPGSTSYPNGGMTRAQTKTLPSGWNQVFSCVPAPDFDYMYLGGDTPVRGEIYKVDLTSLEPIASLRLPNGQEKIRTICIEPDGDYAYVGTYTVPPFAARINLKTFTHDSTTTATSIVDGFQASAMNPDGKKAYFFPYSSPGRALELDLPTMSFTNSIADGPTPFVNEASMDPDGKYVYVAGNISSVDIARLEADSFAWSGSVNLPTNEFQLKALARSPTHPELYVGTDFDPARVIKVNTDSFTRVGAITLNPGESHLYSLIIDHKGRFMYAGTSTEPSTIIRIDLDTFQRIGALTLPFPENYMRSGFVMPSDDFVIFAGYGFPSRILKVATSQRGMVKGTKITVPEIGSVDRIRFHSHFADGNVRVALYSDAPNMRLVWQSDVVPNDATNSDIEFMMASGFPSSITLAAGDYWLAWQIDTKEAVPSYSAGESATGFVLAQEFGPFPPEILASARILNSENWTISLDYSPAPALSGWQVTTQ